MKDYDNRLGHPEALDARGVKKVEISRNGSELAGNRTLRIYVDFDDCLCETGRFFPGLVKKLFGKDIPYEDMRYFELDKSFSLNPEEFEHMMTLAHEPEELLSFAETPGASETLNSWLDKGYEVSVITGRPFSAYEASREWLDRHNLKDVNLHCLNKYGYDGFIKDCGFSLELADYYKMHFDYAVEDSPNAFRFFDHLPELKVMVYDRPWNRECEFPNGNYTRCTGWERIKELVGTAT